MRRKRRMGRPNGHSPKDKVIRILVKSIKSLTEKKKSVSDQLKTEKKTLGLYRNSVSKCAAPRRRYRRRVKKVVRKRIGTAKPKRIRMVTVRKVVKKAVKKMTKKAPAKKKAKEFLPF